MPKQYCSYRGRSQMLRRFIQRKAVRMTTILPSQQLAIYNVQKVGPLPSPGENAARLPLGITPPPTAPQQQLGFKQRSESKDPCSLTKHAIKGFAAKKNKTISLISNVSHLTIPDTMWQLIPADCSVFQESTL